MKAKKKIQVTTESAGAWGKGIGYFCLATEEGDNGWHFTGRIYKRPRDARRSFVNICNRLGIPRKNYEFFENNT